MHVFITGGTRGIGHGLVKEFLKKGHQVSFTGTSEKSVSKGSEDLNGEFIGFVCDVRYRDMIEISMKLALDKFGDIDIWINNAGVDQDRLEVSEFGKTTEGACHLVPSFPGRQMLSYLGRETLP